MTPMQKAWLLLKMPIVSEEPLVEYAMMDGKEFPLPRVTHEFQDPKTGEIMPLQITPYGGDSGLHGNTGNIAMNIGQDGEESNRAFSRANPVLNQKTGKYSDYKVLDGSETLEDYQRRGYMTALYDALESYLANYSPGSKFLPSGNLSPKMQKLWQKRLTSNVPVRRGVTGRPTFGPDMHINRG